MQRSFLPRFPTKVGRQYDIKGLRHRILEKKRGTSISVFSIKDEDDDDDVLNRETTHDCFGHKLPDLFLAFIFFF